MTSVPRSSGASTVARELQHGPGSPTELLGVEHQGQSGGRGGSWLQRLCECRGVRSVATTDVDRRQRLPEGRPAPKCGSAPRGPAQPASADRATAPPARRPGRGPGRRRRRRGDLLDQRAGDVGELGVAGQEHRLDAGEVAVHQRHRQLVGEVGAAAQALDDGLRPDLAGRRRRAATRANGSIRTFGRCAERAAEQVDALLDARTCPAWPGCAAPRRRPRRTAPRRG